MLSFPGGLPTDTGQVIVMLQSFFLVAEVQAMLEGVPPLSEQVICGVLGLGFGWVHWLGEPMKPMTLRPWLRNGYPLILGPMACQWPKMYFFFLAGGF